MQTAKTYYRLTKPGIVYGNDLMAIAGYFFAGGWGEGPWKFVAMLAGISFVMASACVYNNILDRPIDALMSRTKKRALVSGEVSGPAAFVFATILVVVGSLILGLGTNLLTVAVALFGHFAYVVLYGIAKRKSVHGTLVGTISGSTPPVIGYVAVSGQLDVTALILFLLMVAWQMPHFFAIAIFRRDDYAAANIPVLSVVKGLKATRRQIILYVIAYILSVLALGVLTNADLLTTGIILLAALYWLYLCLQPVIDGDINRWARKQFGYSLSLLLVMCLCLSINPLLH